MQHPGNSPLLDANFRLEKVLLGTLESQQLPLDTKCCVCGNAALSMLSTTVISDLINARFIRGRSFTEATQCNPPASVGLVTHLAFHFGHPLPPWLDCKVLQKMVCQSAQLTAAKA